MIQRELLTEGDSGADVLFLQKTLSSMGFEVQVDGKFGPNTRRAVMTFQSNNNLRVDGFVGKNTWALLESAGNRRASSHLPIDPLEIALTRVGVVQKLAAEWTPILRNTFNWADIRTQRQRAMFVANVLHESNFLRNMVENLNYSPTALRTQWGRRFSAELAQQCGRTADHAADPRMIAIHAYGGRYGNDPFPSEDGWKFRGRGPFQLTFKSNYRDFQEDTGIPVLANPDIVSTPDVGSKAAAWFWRTRKCNDLAEKSQVQKVRYIINGGTNGLDEVEHLYTRLLPILG